MTGFFSERTMQRLQMKEDLPEHYKGRIRWMQLACSLAIAFHLYQAMRGFGNLANSDSSSVEEVEEFLDIINNICDSELTMSEYYETKNRSVDLSISYYERYKKINGILESDLYHPDAAEILFKELYEDYRKLPFVEVFFLHCSEVCIETYLYMLKKLSYQEFIDSLSSCWLFGNGRKLDSTMLKSMILLGEKWVKRYIEIVKQLNKEMKKN